MLGLGDLRGLSDVKSYTTKSGCSSEISMEVYMDVFFFQTSVCIILDSSELHAGRRIQFLAMPPHWTAFHSEIIEFRAIGLERLNRWG